MQKSIPVYENIMVSKAIILNEELTLLLLLVQVSMLSLSLLILLVLVSVLSLSAILCLRSFVQVRSPASSLS